MRILPAALVVSATLHASAIAWVHGRPRVDLEDARPVTPRLELVEIEPPPMAVALLEDHTTSLGVPSPPTGTLVLPARGHATISTGSGAVTGTETTPGHDAGPAPFPTAPEIGHGMSAEFLKHFLDSSKPLVPNPIEGERITDDIARDRQRLNDPRWIANATPDEVLRARQALVAHLDEAHAHELQPDGAGYKATHSTFVARIAPDGTAHLDDRPNIQRHGLGLTFDVTDGLMRHFGQDPYASNKLRFLDQTRDERYQIGMQSAHRQLAHTPRLVQQNIDRLWATTTTVAARKAALFELWDECAETGSDDLVAAGLAARQLVVGTIRARLIGATAYTAAELASFNARRTSHSRFDPYVEMPTGS